MSHVGERIILGAAGWGLPYGLSGHVPSDDVLRALLERAHALGIREIDTAPAYGNSETRTATMVKEFSFLVRTKVTRALDALMDESVERSIALFDGALSRIQFHNYEGTDAAAVERLRVRYPAIAFGATTYGPDAAQHAFAQLGCVQLEWNVLNPAALAAVEGARHGKPRGEVSVRSVLLQGLLAGAAVPKHLRALAPALVRFKEIAEAQRVTPGALALASALSHPAIDKVLLGVDNAEQLEQVVEAAAVPKQAIAELHGAALFSLVSDRRLIDPRAWPQLANEDPTT